MIITVKIEIPDAENLYDATVKLNQILNAGRMFVLTNYYVKSIEDDKTIPNKELPKS